MRDHLLGFIIAMIVIAAIFVALSLIQIKPVEAGSPITDQWVPVNRAVSMTSTDNTKVFTWTSVVEFVGAGLDDETVGGTFTGHREMSFIAEVEDASQNPDTFMWSSDGGHTWTESVNMSSGAVTLEENVTILWAAVNGHTDRDSWHWTQHTVGHSDVAAVAFTGSGLNDATSSGTYVGHRYMRYRVQIDASVPDPDTFKWSDDNGISWEETTVGIVAATPYHLSNDVAIQFAAANGHTVGNYWDIVASPASQQLLIGTINWACTAGKAGAYLKFYDENGNNQFGIIPFTNDLHGEILYDPPVALPIGLDLLLDTTAADTGIIYINVNGWLRDLDY